MTTLQNKLTNKELMSYFGYGVGQCFSFGLVGSFILYFYTDILGISPIAASTIFFDCSCVGCGKRSAHCRIHGHVRLSLW